MRFWPFGRKEQLDVRTLARLGEEVKWLQEKFDKLLEMQQLSFLAEKETIGALQNLDRRVRRLEELSGVVILPEEEGGVSSEEIVGSREEEEQSFYEGE